MRHKIRNLTLIPLFHRIPAYIVVKIYEVSYLCDPIAAHE